MSHIKDSNNFMHKIRDLKDIPNDTLLVTADVVGLYPSIPHEAGLQALKKVLEHRKHKNKVLQFLSFQMRYPSS